MGIGKSACMHACIEMDFGYRPKRHKILTSDLVFIFVHQNQNQYSSGEMNEVKV